MISLAESTELRVARARKVLRLLLNILVLVLVFEGLGRRLVGGGLWGKAIFFFKDVIVVLLIPYVWRTNLPPYAAPFASAFRAVALLFTPLVVLTAVHDPLLAAFGTKQYLLFPVVFFATVSAYADADRESILKHLQRLSLLIIPTGLMALLQLRLPSDHWLNLTPDRGSMEAFSAAGRLRVSSTFPFVAQFTMFLNCALYFSAAALAGASDLKSTLARWSRWSLVPLLIVATFSTGSRGAVIGALLIFAVATVLASLKRGGFAFGKLVSVGSILFGLVTFLSFRFPQYFEAYSARSTGRDFGIHDVEVTGRVSDMLFGWFQRSETLSTLIGHGLGIMSNGAELLSQYAAHIRLTIGWGEMDLANTYLEGGIYLVLVWSIFRLRILWLAARAYFAAASIEAVLPLSFILGYALVTGVGGQLGIQPPLSIWWWLSLGFLLLLANSDTVSADSGSLEVESKKVAFRQQGRSSYAQRLHQTAGAEPNGPA